MATQSVDYVSCKKICCGTLPASVIICLPPSLVLSPNCPGSETLQPYERGYVAGEIFSERVINSACHSGYIYTLTIDDTQLVPGTVLSGTEITGIICQTCLTEWVTDLVGDEVQVQVDQEASEVTITSQHGCETTFSIAGEETPPCVVELTTAELNALVTANGLTVGCTYVITDHTQGRVSQNGPARVFLTALSVDQLTTACSVITTYDTQAWRGVYDLASNTLVELEDNQGNVCRQYQDTFVSLTPVNNFDWGNPSYISCLVDNATWTVDYGLVGDIYRVKVTDRAVFNLTGWTGDYLYNVEISGFSDVDFSNGDMEAEEFYVLNGSGVECFSTNPNNFLYYTTCDYSFITVDNPTASLYVEGTSLQGNSGIYHRAAGDLNVFAANLRTLAVIRTGEIPLNPSSSITEAYVWRADLSGAINTSSVDIRGVNTDAIDIFVVDVSSAGSIRVSGVTSLVEVFRSSVDTEGLLNVTTSGTVLTTKVTQGELANAGFDLTDVYMIGAGTKTCTANNTAKGKDYFNDNIV